MDGQINIFVFPFLFLLVSYIIVKLLQDYFILCLM